MSATLRFKEETEVPLLLVFQREGEGKDREIGEINSEGSFFIDESDIANCAGGVLRLSLEEQGVIFDKAKQFQRKCDVEALVAACEAVMTLKQFPMVNDSPSDSPVAFNDETDGNVSILKDEKAIGLMRSRGAEFGRLILCYPVMHTGLTEADKAAIVAKCREIVVAITF